MSSLELVYNKIGKKIGNDLSFKMFVISVLMGMSIALGVMYVIHTSKIESLVAINSVQKDTIVVLEKHYFNDENTILTFVQSDIADKYVSGYVSLEKKRTVIVIENAINHISNIRLDPSYVKLIAGGFYNSSIKHGVKWQELIAIAWQENRFNYLRESNKGARGLMQIMPLWVLANTLNENRFRESTGIKTLEDLNDPIKSIDGGAYIFKHYQKYWESRGIKNRNKVVHYARLTYNRGPVAMNKDIKRGIIPDNGYSLMITNKINRISKLSF
jgi:soluble lytic murein transglycosylase-like protein